jgi:hypothetical protein
MARNRDGKNEVRPSLNAPHRYSLCSDMINRCSCAPPWEAEGRRRPFTESDALFIFLMKARDPARFNRKMLTVAGDINNPLLVHQTGNPDERVHSSMPSNGRDQPEELEEDEQPPTIEGEGDETEAA